MVCRVPDQQEPWGGLGQPQGCRLGVLCVPGLRSLHQPQQLPGLLQQHLLGQLPSESYCVSKLPGLAAVPNLVSALLHATL